jgi:proline iminopeptidase
MSAPGVITGAALAGATAAVYGKLVRPRLARWGASDDEVTTPFPGDDIVPFGERGATMATTINASPKQVWPWLMQLGGDRGGWYSWDHLDNAGHPSAKEVHPEWQDRKVGDYLKFRAPGQLVDAFSVVMMDPERFLGLHGLSDLMGRPLDPEKPRPSIYMEGLWGFFLKELPGGRTRLVIGGYQAMRPRWVERVYNYWIYVPVVWIMQARMLSVLKRNIERANSAAQTASAEAVTGPSEPQTAYS